MILLLYTTLVSIHCLLHNSSKGSIVCAGFLILSLVETCSCSYKVQLAMIIERTYANSAEECGLLLSSRHSPCSLSSWAKAFCIQNVTRVLKFKREITQIIK